MFSREYIGQVKASGVIVSQNSHKSKEELERWFNENVNKGRFKGHELHLKKRLLFRNKPIFVTYEQKLLMIFGVLIIFLIWKLSRV